MARRRQAITIRHVAADAGVSLQTVSRVVNHEPNVRQEIQERVRASIAKLGYVPSIAARRMSGARSRLIMALNDRERTIAAWRDRQGTDWFDQMLLGGMLTAEAHGYRMIVELVDTQGDQIERELAGAIAALRPDGVILTPPHSGNPAILALLEAQGIGMARIGSTREGPGITLTMGDEQAAYAATEHLAALGHRRIGFVAGPDEYELSGWRVEGWRAAMAQAGLSTEGLFARGDFSFGSGLAAAPALLDAGATAIVASNDQMALAAVEVAKGRGLELPRDLSLVSFDDTPIVRFHHPPLAAITQPIAEVTAQAVKALIANAAGEEIGSLPIVVPAPLTVRGSTAAPAA